jgi:hypothetical protein
MLAPLVCMQANELLGLGPGQVFVQRNVGNLASHKDTNCMSCLEYAVNVLKVRKGHRLDTGSASCSGFFGSPASTLCMMDLSCTPSSKECILCGMLGCVGRSECWAGHASQRIGCGDGFAVRRLARVATKAATRASYAVN